MRSDPAEIMVDLVCGEPVQANKVDCELGVGGTS